MADVQTASTSAGPSGVGADSAGPSGVDTGPNTDGLTGTAAGSGDGTEDELCPRAEIFRSKLIDDFHLIDSVTDKGVYDVPKYYSKDIINKARLSEILKMSPNGIVRFQVYSASMKVSISEKARRWNRVLTRNSKYPPLDLWSNRILESNGFQTFMLLLILFNSVALGVQSELQDNTSDNLTGIKLTLEIFDYCVLAVFMLEILMKWIDDFWSFWRNGWNIFDFLVTTLTFLPELLTINSARNSDDTSGLNVIVKNLRVFRILRSLKMVSRFRQVRLIALAITKAIHEMTFIGLLFITFAYIYAIAGVVLFESYTNSNREDLLYQESFKNLATAFATLFQIFTLDHWYSILKDVWKITNGFSAGIYIISWICIGSFIFRNIFVGIMVNNFQNIRKELVSEVKQQVKLKEIIDKEEKFTNELYDQRMSRERRKTISPPSMCGGKSEEMGEDNPEHVGDIGDNVPRRDGDDSREAENDPGHVKNNPSDFYLPSVTNLKSVHSAVSQRVLESANSSHKWMNMVNENLELLSERQLSETVWPRDTLFRYFELMEKLQENLEERQQIHEIATRTILSVHNSVKPQ